MFNISIYNEMKGKLNYNENQSNFYITNKYMRILNQMVKDKRLKKSHVAFTFSYLYLTSYLFRYTKYHDVQLDVKEIKKILQYSPIAKDINYIIKKGGLLDEVGLTETLYDFPIVHEIIDNQLEFTMLSSFNSDGNAYGSKWRELHGINYNSSCKYPVLGFFENIDDYKQVRLQLGNCGGSFYTTEDTTNIPIEVFMYCMSHEGLGCTGFYLYSFIAFRNNIGGNCQLSITDLAKNCMLSSTSVIKYLNVLREYNLIQTVVAEMYVYGYKRGSKYKPEANSHFINSLDKFLMHNDTLEIEKPNYTHISKADKIEQTLDTIDFF